MDCPEISGALGAYIDLETDPADAQVIAGHLELCGECRAMEARLRSASAVVERNLARYRPGGRLALVLPRVATKNAGAPGAGAGAGRASTAVTALTLLVGALFGACLVRLFDDRSGFGPIGGLVAYPAPTSWQTRWDEFFVHDLPQLLLGVLLLSFLVRQTERDAIAGIGGMRFFRYAALLLLPCGLSLMLLGSILAQSGSGRLSAVASHTLVALSYWHPLAWCLLATYACRLLANVASSLEARLLALERTLLGRSPEEPRG
ncbi:MAG: zf-HC2 domain-containing protein [Planctomycetes bacterium]|nr:zf-HC2 domain-containing protein [Planctomycetota bacterium]